MSQKGLAPITIIVGILIAVIIAGGAYYLGRQTTPKSSPAVVSQTPQPTPSPTPDASPVPNGTGETANWKTYTNTVYQYSLKYPPHWQYIICQSSNNFYFDPNPACETDDPGVLTLHIDNEIKQPLINISDEFQAVSKKVVTIGNEQGEKILVEKVKPAPGADKITIAAVTHNGKTYTFNLQDINEENTLDQILSTFKFLP